MNLHLSLSKFNFQSTYKKICENFLFVELTFFNYIASNLRLKFWYKKPSVLILFLSPITTPTLDTKHDIVGKRNKSIEYLSLLYNFLLARRVQLLMSITKYIQTQCLVEWIRFIVSYYIFSTSVYKL